jgi:hypothetical protein
VSELNVYLKPDLTWGWRLRGDDQRIIAIDGTSGYPDPDEAFEVANRVVNGEYLGALRTRSS